MASPNHNPRPVGMPVDTVVLHADAAADAKASISWIRAAESKVSYHVLIDRDGTAYRFVEVTQRAWHAGKSIYERRNDVNNFSIGLSFANKNDGVEPYTDVQYDVGAALVAGWMKVYPAISTRRITTHAIIRQAYRDAHPAENVEEKHDPGPMFDMPRFIALVEAEAAKPPAVA